MNITPRRRQALFWAVLAVFLLWDLLGSARIDRWREPPLLAAGSGQAPSGGHCSMAK